jgi:glutaredoxin 3
MSKVTIYTRPMCGYCARAVSILKQKGVEINEIDAGFDRELRQEMTKRSNGGTTFPQIFIGDIHVGGCDELMNLERHGKLDPLIASA